MSTAHRLDISTAPFLHQGRNTSRVMLEVLMALVPVIISAVYFFGVSALMLIAVTVLACVLTEASLAKDGINFGVLKDNSALLTGVLLGLTLPPATPLWVAALGGIIAMVLGKAIWGGLGQNMFNPALVGRAFLQAAFPSLMTTWTLPESFLDVAPSTFAVPLMSAQADVVTAATPLALSKFDGKVTEVGPLFFGNTAGSLGETAGVIILLCGLYLIYRKIFDWRLMVSTLLSVAIFAAILHQVDPKAYPGPEFMLLSGGLMFGAVYMVTDPVTTPITSKGAWIFGAGVGVLVVLIRLWGGLPEGVMFSILLMNSVTPLINRYTQPRPFGSKATPK